jgi:pentatricopeptide repeat protein
MSFDVLQAYDSHFHALCEKRDTREGARIGRKLGHFYLLRGDSDSAVRILRKCQELFSKELGQRDYCRLHSDLLLSLFHSRGDVRKLPGELEDVMSKQNSSPEPDLDGASVTQTRLGLAYYFLMVFSDAQKHLSEASMWLQCNIVHIHEHLRSQLYLGYVYNLQDKLEDATRILEDVKSRWERALGQQNPATLMAGSALASCYCKNGNLRKAIDLYQMVLQYRQQEHATDPGHYTVTDVALSLAYALRKGGRTKDSGDILDSIDTTSMDLEREMQIRHFRALQLLDQGKYESARKMLQTAIIETLRGGKCNLELLWMVQSYSQVPPHLDEEFRQICELLIAPSSGPILTSAVSSALKILRNGQLEKSLSTLQEKGLAWRGFVRENIQILAGAPITDTAFFAIWQKP